MKDVWGTRTTVVLVLALLYPLLSLMQERPVSMIDDTPDAVTPEYNNRIDLQTPVLTGRILKFVSYLICRTWIGPYYIRYLLNINGILEVRKLAILHRDLPATSYPIHRISEQEILEAQRIVETTGIQEILQSGRGLEDMFVSSSSLPPSSLEQQHLATTEQQQPNKKARYYSTMDYYHVYQSKKATPSMVIQRVIAACQELQTKNHFLTKSFHPDRILEQAEQSDLRWTNQQPISILDGVPVVVKDLFDIENHELCDGGTKLRCWNATRDGTTVSRLRQMGAIIVGLTLMTEGGVTTLGYNAHYDGPMNPYGINHYCGGSSSGSAVAVAMGVVPLALGMDGGGSIRVPASMSGVFGLATTYGRIPFDRARGTTMVKAGPLAATVSDVAVSYLVLSQVNTSHYHHMQVGTVPPPHLGERENRDGASTTDDAGPPLKGMRLGIYWDHFSHADPEITAACWKAVEVLQQGGAELVNVTIPHLRELQLAHAFKILSEFGRIWEADYWTVPMESNTEITVAMGRALRASEVLSADMLRTYGLQVVCKDIFRAQQIDAIVSPMLGIKVPQPTRGYRGYGESNTGLVYATMRFVPLANLLGLPAMSIPVGYEEDTGLPIGFQLLGDAWSEHKLIRMAGLLEQHPDIPRRTPTSEYFVDILGPYL